jgi:hypothetical protein
MQLIGTKGSPGTKATAGMTGKMMWGRKMTSECVKNMKAYGKKVNIVIYTKNAWGRGNIKVLGKQSSKNYYAFRNYLKKYY